MLSHPWLLFQRLSRRLAVRVLLGAVIALCAALVAPLAEPLIPEDWKSRFGRDAVLPILNILASSMLAVTTFSLSVMVQAFQAAASQATPRAYRLHLADPTTQTVLATFVGSFLFSLTSIVLFRAGLYSDAAAVVIFGVTALVIAAIVVAILRWIDHLSQLGSMDNTLQLVEDHATPVLRRTLAHPALEAQPMVPGTPPPESARPVPAPRGGYVQLVDVKALNELIPESGGMIIDSAPGAHVVKGAPLGWVWGGEVETEALADRFTIGAERSMEQDARYGVMVLNEIALRALSAGVNDPGTAIDVIQRLTRMLAEAGVPEEDTPAYPRLRVAPVTAQDLMQDAFHPIIRCGASMPEVIGMVFDGLDVLEGSAWTELAEAAAKMRGYARHHAAAALTVEEDLDWLDRKAAKR